MNNFFSFEGNDSWKPYMPQTKVSPLGPEGLMGGSSKLQPYGAPQDSMSFQPPSGLMSQPPAGAGGSSKKKKPKKEENKDVTRPSASYEPDYSAHEGVNTQDPFNPNNWTYNQQTGEYEWSGQETFDPNNYEWDTATNAPKYVGDTAWNPDRYTDTLYDPSNPFDLTENEWAKLMGDLNSGSLFEEGMGLAKNVGLAGGLSDMGGVADEIVSQSGKGLMGKILPYAAAAKAIYGIARGHTGLDRTKAIVDAASALNPISAAANMGMKVAQNIENIHNRPSRDYADPFYAADLGNGNKFMMVYENSDPVYDQNTPDQSWTGAVNEIANGHEQSYWVQDANGNYYSIPADVIFPQGTQSQADLDAQKQAEDMNYYAMGGGGNPDNRVANANFIGSTYSPEQINKNVNDYMATHPEAAKMSLFKDTPVFAYGKDPMTVDSLSAAFDAAQKYGYQDYGEYENQVIQNPYENIYGI